MEYVDGFLLPLPKDRIDGYRAMAEQAGKVWLEHGALAYRECIAEDMSPGEMTPFPSVIGAKENETVVFAYIVFRSREHRDEVNAKVMADPRMHGMCDPNNPPFDFKRMAYGGFSSLVQLG